MLNVKSASPPFALLTVEEEDEQSFPSLKEWLEGREGLYRFTTLSQSQMTALPIYLHYIPLNVTKQMPIICFTTLPPRDRRGRLEAVCREEGVSGTMSSSFLEIL